MNGIDTVAAVVITIVLLIFSPLWQYKELSKEVKYAAVKKLAEVAEDDTELVIKSAEILGVGGRLESITLEGKLNSELYPYIFKEKAVGMTKKKGSIIVYGF